MTCVKIVQSYRFRIYPTPAQEAAFRQIAGCCRLVYNLGLEQRRDHWRRFKSCQGRHISYQSQQNELPELKRAFPFLRDVPSHCLQAALSDLDKAYQRFFEGVSQYPTPRRKMDGDSFRFPDPGQFSLTPHWLHAPKFGRRPSDHGKIRINQHQRVKGIIKTITIIRDGRHWYACLASIHEVSVRPQPSADLRVVGIDRGVTVPVALSDGSLLGRATEGKPEARRLKRLQQSVARKVKGSANRRKAIYRLTAFKAHQARRRKDQLHKISSTIVKNHDVITLEDLKIDNMTASARGTLTAPGSRVAQKAGLNRAILDKGWGIFGTMLAYKAGWVGKRVIKVAAHHTSQTCIACGHISPENRKIQDAFACVACGHAEHADTHAAKEIRRRGLKIILAEGHSVSACGELCAGISEAGRSPVLPEQDQTSHQNAATAA
ncbi:RNA-guided endonuclease InsQ/TnpB family protein [Loktanella sp. DJP18]|uniref:RNA-guided endonuclease InsQ/TnpB family protein n=1 Tax=Loktanella sp. DJP18 TaxID=3409788 RepID=UPI003BB64E16